MRALTLALFTSLVGAAGIWRLAVWTVVAHRITVRERDEALAKLVAAQKYAADPPPGGSPHGGF